MMTCTGERFRLGPRKSKEISPQAEADGGPNIPRRRFRLDEDQLN